MMLPKSAFSLVVIAPALAACSGFGAISMGGLGGLGGDSDQANTQVEPAMAAPTTLVETTTLPPLVGGAEGADPFQTAAADPNAGTPLYPALPSTSSLYPETPQPGAPVRPGMAGVPSTLPGQGQGAIPAGQGLPPTVPGQPLGAPGLPTQPTDLALLPAATPVQVTRENLLGGWTITTGTETCQLFLTLTAWTGGYRASTPSCNSPTLQTIAAWDLSGQQVVLSGAEGVPVARLTSSGATRFDGQTEATATPITFFR